MYSVVLLTALTVTAEAPDWRLRGHGCCGCYGYSSCYGGCYGGYGSYDGCGCNGGWSYGGCWGGYGGCYGGCWGGGWGGCYGGCYGGYWSSGYGCCGCYGSDMGSGYYNLPPNPEGSGSPKGSPEGSGSPKGSPEGSGTGKVGSGEVRAPRTPGPAKIVLDVPEDARVYVDNRLMKSTSTHRVYASPALDYGQAYFYDVRIEVDVDGKVVSTTKRVVIRAGEEYTESFASLGKSATAVATSKNQK